MSHRTELERRVRMLSEAEIDTVLRFVQFLEAGHVRPRVGNARELRRRAEMLIEDIAEVVQTEQAPEVELVYAPLEARPDVLEGAIEVPESEWGVTLDGFSHVMHDLSCHLWVKPAEGEAFTLAKDAPLGQIYFEAKGSERSSVQVALNRTGTVYDVFRFMHRVAEPRAIYLKLAEHDGLADVVIESEGQLTVLEVGIPERPAPRLRRLLFLELIKEHEASGREVSDVPASSGKNAGGTPRRARSGRPARSPS